MPLMKDKYLFLSLWSAYDGGLGGLKDAAENIHRIKLDEKIKERLSPATQEKDFVPMYNYNIKLPFSSLLQQSFRNIKMNIESNIKRLEIDLNN